MFHLRRNDENVSLLEYLLDKRLHRQKEQLMDIFIKVDIGIGDWYCSTNSLYNVF